MYLYDTHTHIPPTYLATHGESSEWSCVRARHHSLHLVHIVVVQNSLHGRGTKKDCVLKFWRQGDPQDFMASSQDKPFQEGMKDMGPIAHQTDILGKDERRRDKYTYLQSVCEQATQRFKHSELCNAISTQDCLMLLYWMVCNN